MMRARAGVNTLSFSISRIDSTALPMDVPARSTRSQGCALGEHQLVRNISEVHQHRLPAAGVTRLVARTTTPLGALRRISLARV